MNVDIIQAEGNYYLLFFYIIIFYVIIVIIIITILLLYFISYFYIVEEYYEGEVMNELPVLDAQPIAEIVIPVELQAEATISVYMPLCPPADTPTNAQTVPGIYIYTYM